jgi:transcriptional regulator of arginine metabolism
MTKSLRQSTILSIIGQEAIETQEQLTEKLHTRGIKATQATVSRDVKELRLTKALLEDGGYRYVSPSVQSFGISERMIRVFAQTVVSMTEALNLLVVKTLPGAAHAAGEAIDNLGMAEIVGTLAGDNTCVIITHRNSEVPYVMDRLRQMLDAGT